MHRESLGPVVRVLALVLLIILLVVKMSLPRTHISSGEQFQRPQATSSQVAPATPEAAETLPDSEDQCPAEEQCDTVSWECCTARAE
jgi:hypothetical protein